ncbi:hypothetical protein V8C37DRAFT_368811 [Trichoderma ceciliae]
MFWSLGECVAPSRERKENLLLSPQIPSPPVKRKRKPITICIWKKLVNSSAALFFSSIFSFFFIRLPFPFPCGFVFFPSLASSRTWLNLAPLTRLCPNKFSSRAFSPSFHSLTPPLATNLGGGKRVSLEPSFSFLFLPLLLLLLLF